MKLKIKAGVFFILLISSISGFSFEFDQHFVNYKGGIISSLNNCGVNYDASGRYLRGGAATLPIYNGGQRVLYLKEIENGVLTIFGNGIMSYSANGLNLEGGGQTTQLAQLASGNRERVLKVRNVEKIDDDIYILHDIEKTRSVAGVPRPRTVQLITVIRNALKGVSVVENQTTNLSFIGQAHDNLYVQRNGENHLHLVDTINQALDGQSGTPLHHIPAMSVVKIEEYNNDILILGNGHVYKGTGKLISNITELYSQFNGTIRNIMVNVKDTFIPIFTSDITTIIPITISDSVYIATSNGNIWNSVHGYVNYALSKERLQGLFLALTIYNNYGNPKLSLLENGNKKTFGSGLFFGGVEDTLEGYAITFSGQAATVGVEDKGWDGFEYKWRRRSDQSGVLAARNSGSFLGESEIRITAKNDCVALVTLENNSLTPISFDPTSVFTVATNVFKANSFKDFFNRSCKTYDIRDGKFGCPAR